MRGRKSKYAAKRERKGTDKYGRFDQGVQISPDRIVGKIVWIKGK